MGNGRSRELRTFQRLAQLVSAGHYDPDAILDGLREDVRGGFGLVRVDVLRPDEPATGHPLVQRAAREGCAVREGNRVAVPLDVEGECLGFLIGDANGGELVLDDAGLQLLDALVQVAAVFVANAREHGRLERSLLARTRFVSLASHELRTPIAVVHGIVSTLHLRGDELRPEQRRELRATAFEQTSRLAILTEQLLDLSRLESGVVTPKSERFRPHALVRSILARLVPERAGDVVVEIDPGLELDTDPDGVERVLSNLIVNALRYGEPPVCVRLELDGFARLVVEDAGVGIEPELLPRLFERFSRGADAGAGGSGLGLAIAQSYAEALCAALDYEPATPHGARFSLTLPRAAVASATAP